MKNELTSDFISRVLKLDSTFKVSYNVTFTNIEVLNKVTGNEIFVNIHKFIHTDCKDYLLSYSNGIKAISETRPSKLDKRVQELYFTINVKVPNLLDEGGSTHTETFSGLSELILYINAIEWLVKYRKDNHKLSKFWLNKF